MHNEYLYIFVHIPKTAGSTFNYHIKRNFPKESLSFSRNELGIHPENIPKTFTECNNLVKKFTNNLSKEKKAKTKIIYGHFIPYGIHRYFNRPARYFTFFRDPISRIVSLYNFKRGNFENIKDLGKLRIFYKNTFLLENKIPTFTQWLDKKYKDNKSQDILNYVSFLKRLGYLKSFENLDNLFKKFYFVGITSNYDSDALFLYKKLGIKKFYKNRNVSMKYFTLSSNSPLRNKILNICQNDQNIYLKAKDINKSFQESKEYQKIVAIKKIEQLLFLPFTQYILQPMQTAKALKHKLLKLNLKH